MKILMFRRITILLFLFFTTKLVYSQTTGKISGTVSEKETGSPLIGVNILLEGTTMGAATDIDGNYFILNIPPGSYNLRFQILGYEHYIVQDLRVSVNRTTNVDAEMITESVEISEVVVMADKITTKKDQTGSIKNVSSEQILNLPVEDIDDVVAAFARGAANAVALGFDALELHGAHGYLIDQFFWEGTNQRTDQYGGSIESR